VVVEIVQEIGEFEALGLRLQLDLVRGHGVLRLSDGASG